MTDHPRARYVHPPRHDRYDFIFIWLWQYNRGGHGWEATIRYPVKQPYVLSEIKKLLHFIITLLNLKYRLPFPLQIIRPDRDTCIPFTRV